MVDEKMTIEGLAQTSQKEFLAIGKRFDTVDENISLLQRDVEAGFMGVSDGMKAIMAKLEKKIGLGTK